MKYTFEILTRVKVEAKTKKEAETLALREARTLKTIVETEGFSSIYNVDIDFVEYKWYGK